MVGSEAEYKCLAVALKGVGSAAWVQRLDCASARIDGGNVGEGRSSVNFGVCGQSGFLVSRMGLDISRLSIDDAREERD